MINRVLELFSGVMDHARSCFASVQAKHECILISMN